MEEATGKIAVYTCIVNNYDSLRPIPQALYGKMKDRIDFICLTDNVDLYSRNPGNWKVVDMPVQLSNLLKTNPVKAQRMVKVLPMKFLPDRYDISLWIDSNIEIRGNLLTDFFPKYDLNKCPIYTNKHPQRKCIYDEELMVIRLKKDDPAVCKAQITHYMGEKYPVNNGLAETNVILRRNNDPSLVKMSYLWGEQILKWSRRDQLSFDYSCWKTGLKYSHLKEDYAVGKVLGRVQHGKPKEILKIEELEKRAKAEKEASERRQREIEDLEKRAKEEREAVAKSRKQIEELEKTANENREAADRRKKDLEALERKAREQEQKMLGQAKELERMKESILTANVDFEKLGFTSVPAHFFRIIIPNYNNSQFIRRCLDSLINQTFKDFFVIIVDDFSTDDSFEICKTYQRKFPTRFLCINAPQKGYAGSARNFGMKVKINSEYTWFIDGDDWLYSNRALETAFENLKNLKYDMLLFKPAFFQNGELTTTPSIRKFNFNDTDNLISSPHRGAPFKIIKSSKVAPFLEGNSRSEDVYQFALQLENSSTFIQINEPLYVYNIYNGSTSHATTNSGKIQNIRQALHFRKELGMLKGQITKKSVKLAIERRLEAETFMVVSFTSMPRRIKNVKEIVQSMLGQTTIPDLIVLYLNKNDFKDTPLPNDLVEFANDPLNRFDIRWVDVDWSSHTKYIYAFQDFPNEVVITIDDDFLYERHFLEYLMAEYAKYKSSKCIVCHFSQEIYKDKDRFSVKDGRSSMKKSIMNRPLSGHGTLFPPKVFENTEVFNHDLAMKLTYKQDEWWIWYLCYKHQIVTINTQAYNWPRYTQGPHQLKIFPQEEALFTTVNSKDRESTIGKMVYDDIFNGNKKANICVVMTATENMAYQYKYTTQINKAYCDRNGYDFKFEISKEGGEEKHYLKRNLILKYLNDYDWIFYMDVDAWFNNFDKKLEDIISKHDSEKNNISLIVAKHNKALVKDSQLELTLVNAGVILVKNSAMGRKTLNDWHYRTPFAKTWLKSITKLNDQPYLCMSIMFNPDIYKSTALVEDVEMNYFTNRVPPYGRTTYVLHASGVNYNSEWLKGMYDALQFTIKNNNLGIKVDKEDFTVK